MNMITGLQEYFLGLEKDFHRRIAEISGECLEESVHQLRTNLKKQVAFFHLLEVLDPTFSVERARESYGDLYKKAGKLRSLQIDRQVLKSLEKEIGLDHCFSSSIDPLVASRREQVQEYAAAFSLTPARRLGRLVRNRLAFLKVSILNDRLLHYFDRLFQETRSFLNPEFRRENQLHELRRRIKELAYQLRLFNGLFQTGKMAPEGLKKLDELQQELGAWHDSHAAAKRLEKPGAKTYPPSRLAEALRRKEAEQEEVIWLNMVDVQVWIDRMYDDLRALLRSERVEAPCGRHRGRRRSKVSFRQLNLKEGSQ